LEKEIKEGLLDQVTYLQTHKADIYQNSLPLHNLEAEVMLSIQKPQQNSIF